MFLEAFVTAGSLEEVLDFPDYLDLLVSGYLLKSDSLGVMLSIKPKPYLILSVTYPLMTVYSSSVG